MLAAEKVMYKIYYMYIDTEVMQSILRWNRGGGSSSRVVQLLIWRSRNATIFLLSLIELSGSRSQHKDVQSIHMGWDASIVQEIIDNYIMCQV